MVDPQTQAPYVLGGDQVWVDAPGPTSLYYPKDIADFSGMTMEDYLRNYKPRIKGAFGNTRFDTLRVVAGQQVTRGLFRFFVIEQGKATTTIDDGATAYTKDENDTNMVQAGQMEKGTIFLADSIQIDVPVTHREFAGLTAAQPTSFVAAVEADTKPASNILVGLQRSARFELWQKRELLAQGRLNDFPVEGGFSGVIGGSTNEGVLQNGFGVSRHLREVLLLGENYLFEMRMYIDRTITNWPIATEIQVQLSGLEINLTGA
jgi:hypothetical protein